MALLLAICDIEIKQVGLGKKLSDLQAAFLKVPAWLFRSRLWGVLHY